MKSQLTMHGTEAFSASSALSRRRRQLAKGLSAVELGVVLTIIVVLAIYTMPKIDSYLIDGKVPKVAEDLRRFMVRNRVNASAAADPNTAFANATQRSFALGVASSTTVSSNTTTYVVQHNLGSGGVITYAAADGGKGYTLTLNKVHQIACANLAGILARDSSKISINGQEQKNTETPVNFSGTNADAACVDGENNTIVFTAGNYEVNAGAR